MPFATAFANPLPFKEIIGSASVGAVVHPGMSVGVCKPDLCSAVQTDSNDSVNFPEP